MILTIVPSAAIAIVKNKKSDLRLSLRFCSCVAKLRIMSSGGQKTTKSITLKAILIDSGRSFSANWFLYE